MRQLARRSKGMELNRFCAVGTPIARLISLSDSHAEPLTQLAAESRISVVVGTLLFPSIVGTHVLVEALLATVPTERRLEATKHIGHIENAQNDCGRIRWPQHAKQMT